MIELQINDLNFLEKATNKEIFSVVGGSCFYRGKEYELGDSVLSNNGTLYTCIKKEDGTLKWKSYSLNSIILATMKFIESMNYN